MCWLGLEGCQRCQARIPMCKIRSPVYLSGISSLRNISSFCTLHMV
jgi:hypothetical protein